LTGHLPYGHCPTRSGNPVISASYHPILDPILDHPIKSNDDKTGSNDDKMENLSIKRKFLHDPVIKGVNWKMEDAQLSTQKT